MALGIPSVVGPISEWMDHVLVEGASPGAEIVVRTADASATVVAKGISGGGRDAVSVVSGITLARGQRLIAQQAMAGGVSDWTPDVLAVAVSAAPTSYQELGPMSFSSRLFACGKALWLTGAAPGALLTVSDANSVLGTGRADGAGTLALGLSSGLPGAGSQITAVQAAPPGFPPLTGTSVATTGSTIALPLGKVLPAPLVLEPLPMGCESSVLIGGVIDGAEVSVERASDNASASAVFHSGQLWFDLPFAFPASGDRIAVTQAMPWCERPPSQPGVADVGPAQTPDAPILAPPCAGSSWLHFERLRPGATLTISIPGQDSLTYVVPPKQTVWDVPVPALPAHENLTATLSVCGFTVSVTVPIIDPAPAPRPEVVRDLYRCGSALSVRTSAGAYVEVWADTSSGPKQLSLRVRAERDLLTVDLLSELVAHEKVWAHQLACGGGWLDSDVVGVLDPPSVDPVELSEPMFDGQQAVLPTNAVSGAHVTVWAAGPSGDEIIGERTTTKADPVVGLTRPLRAKEEIWADQRLCGGKTDVPQHFPVFPAEMTFTLAAPLEQPSGESASGMIIVHTATFTCRFADASWTLEADIENTETKYDCSLTLGVDLSLPSPLVFGGTVDTDLAAAGGLPQGLQSQGVPSRRTANNQGTSSQLQNFAFWQQVLAASASWKLLPAWINYAPRPAG